MKGGNIIRYNDYYSDLKLAIMIWQVLIKPRVAKSWEINAYVLSNISGYIIMPLLVLPVYFVQSLIFLMACLFSFQYRP